MKATFCSRLPAPKAACAARGTLAVRCMTALPCMAVRQQMEISGLRAQQRGGGPHSLRDPINKSPRLLRPAEESLKCQTCWKYCPLWPSHTHFRS